MVLQPQPSEGVLDHILDNPVGREELGGGGDVLLRNLAVFLEALEDLILLFGDIELIEPADELHILTGLHGNGLSQFDEDGVGRQEVIGHQQLGVVVDFLKEEGHDGGPAVAGGDEEDAVGVIEAVVGERLSRQQCLDAPLCHLADMGIEVSGYGLREDFGAGGTVGGGDHSHGRVVVGVHEAQGAEPVEPQIGGGLNDLIASQSLNGVLQFSDAIRRRAPRGAFWREYEGHLVRHMAHELAAGFHGKFLEGCQVHRSSRVMDVLEARLFCSRYLR